MSDDATGQPCDQGPASTPRGRKAVHWRRDPAILARLGNVERRWHAGESNVAIAAALGVAESTIRSDLKRIAELWRERTGRTAAELREQRLRQLEHIRAEAVVAARQQDSKAAALNVARQAVMDMAKLEGLVVDKLAPTDAEGGTIPFTITIAAREKGAT